MKQLLLHYIEESCLNLILLSFSLVVLDVCLFRHNKPRKKYKDEKKPWALRQGRRVNKSSSRKNFFATKINSNYYDCDIECIDL